MMIELKYYGEDPLLAAETIRLVSEHGMKEEVAIMSLNLKGVRQAQRLDAILRVGYLSSADVGNLARLNVNFLALAAGKTTQDLITAARERGQSVYAWTVNDREMMLDMIELGTDSLITDNPALANDVIAQVMDLLPVERLLLRFRHFWDPFDERITAPVDPEE
jgi:glycerophosphoryl diester phosphodiesterase